MSGLPALLMSPHLLFKHVLKDGTELTPIKKLNPSGFLNQTESKTTQDSKFNELQQDLL